MSISFDQAWQFYWPGLLVSTVDPRVIPGWWVRYMTTTLHNGVNAEQYREVNKLAEMRRPSVREACVEASRRRAGAPCRLQLNGAVNRPTPLI